MLCVAALAALLCQTNAAVVTTTPIARVIGLLGKLQAQVEREGKKEAAEYDKYACYCKDEADTTLYNIENSKEKIAVLAADIKKLDAEIDDLDADIKELTATIKEKKEDIATAVKKRGVQNKAYVKEATEIADAIAALEGAIDELKGKKGKMKNAENTLLLQDKLLEVLSSSSTTPTETQIAAVQMLSQAPADPAKNHAYEYKSNDIIGTLENLLKEFKEKKKDANFGEKDKLFAFEEKKQALENERDFAEKDKTEKTTEREDKNTERAAKQKDHDAEKDDMDADQSFLDEITSDCEAKAAQFDQRSKCRSDELTAMSQAMEQLKGGVADNYGSNALAGASFLQMSRGSAAATVAQVAALVSGDAKRLNSASLMGLAVKLNMGGHFDKVVKLIEGLIKKLQDEAKAMADSKTFCDEGMQKAVNKRDKNKLAMEQESATIAMKIAEKKKLGDEVAKLVSEMAELSKSLLEATELRNEEKEDNRVTLADAKEGKTAVDQAIKVLNDFYGAQLLQESKGPNRDGKTVKGSAPKLSYSGDYKGKQDASKGIIGILEVVASDFAKTISDTKSAESDAQGDFDAMEKKINDDTTAKNKLKGEKEDDIKKASSAITQAKDDKIDAETLMETALDELEKITAQCLTGEGTFAERKKQREDEIKSLQGAMKILKAWKAL
jgi:hypothetical protein